MAVLACHSTSMVMRLICAEESERWFICSHYSQNSQGSMKVRFSWWWCFLIMQFGWKLVLEVLLQSVLEIVRISGRYVIEYVGRALQAKVGGSSVEPSWTVDTAAVFLNWTPVWLVGLKCVYWYNVLPSLNTKWISVRQREQKISSPGNQAGTDKRQRNSWMK